MLTGVILAGGQSRRMGTNKALLPFDQEVLIQRQIRIMLQICTDLIVVCNEPQMFSAYIDHRVQWIKDLIPGKGPLSGMHAAFHCSPSADLWVVGCDMPFISAEVASALINIKKQYQCDAILPKVEQKIQPLHGIYSQDCVHSISNMLEIGQFRMNSWLETIHYEVVEESFFIDQGIDLRFVMNMNTPEDYRLALQYFS